METVEESVNADENKRPETRGDSRGPKTNIVVKDWGLQPAQAIDADTEPTPNYN